MNPEIINVATIVIRVLLMSSSQLGQFTFSISEATFWRYSQIHITPGQLVKKYPWLLPDTDQ
jgi:hypothetical protein